MSCQWLSSMEIWYGKGAWWRKQSCLCACHTGSAITRSQAGEHPGKQCPAKHTAHDY